jgi:site-specific DNA-methyltransferase (adenine-specific)
MNMATETLVKKWERVRRLLERARAELGEVGDASEKAPAEELRGTLHEYESFLGHNELELAWDALAAVGRAGEPTAAFWKAMAEAAREMGLNKKAHGAEVRAADVPVFRAFLDVHGTASIDYVVANPDLDRRFLGRCRALGASGNDFELNWQLFNARKNSLLPYNPPVEKFSIPKEVREEFEFASEMAVRWMQLRHQGVALDEIICNPVLADEFDQTAARLVPGFTPLQYRWVALGLRKARRLPTGVSLSRVKPPKFEEVGVTREIIPSDIPAEQGVYLFDCGNEKLFVGETTDLRHRFERHLHAGPDAFPDWMYAHAAPVRFKISPAPRATLSGLKLIELSAIRALRPLFNFTPEDPKRRKKVA